MKHAQKGFTLIEIMIVVAIIAILAAVAIPNFISYRQTSQKNTCLANQEQITTAEEAYFIKNGAYTTTLDDLADKDKGAFLKVIPECPSSGSDKGTYTITEPTGGEPLKVSCDGGPEGYKHVKTESES